MPTDGAIDCAAWVQTSSGQQTTQIGHQNSNTRLVVTVANITTFNLTYIGLDVTSTSNLVSFPQGYTWTETGVHLPLVPPLNLRTLIPLTRGERIWISQSPQNLQEDVDLKVRYGAYPLSYFGTQAHGGTLQLNPISYGFTHRVYV